MCVCVLCVLCERRAFGVCYGVYFAHVCVWTCVCTVMCIFCVPSVHVDMWVYCVFCMLFVYCVFECLCACKDSLVCFLYCVCRMILLVFICCLVVADCAVVNANGSPEIASIDGKMYIEPEFELGRSTLSVVFGARPYGSSDDVSYDWVIKYSCSDMRNEFTAMRILNNTSISPKVYYLSPRVDVAVPGPWYVPERCVGEPLSYLVMDRVGQTIGRAFKRAEGPVPYMERRKTAVKLINAGISVMTHLERMHQGGLVHGDVHGGNIAYRCDDLHSDCNKVVLIDFGEASQVGRGSRTPSNFNPYVLSPWQLLGRPRTHRDDVYRLVQVLANVAANFQLTAVMKGAIGAQEDYLTHTLVERLAVWKVNAFGFKHCYLLPSEICSFLNKQLVPMVTRLTETDMPDHRTIIDVLKQAILLIHLPKVGTPRSTVAGASSATRAASFRLGSRKYALVTRLAPSDHVHVYSSSGSSVQPGTVASAVHAFSRSTGESRASTATLFIPTTTG